MLDAAEAIVREDGIDAVTLRAVAARAHFGKSTVHETFGSTGGLINELRKRAAGELSEIFNLPPPRDDDGTGQWVARQAAEWMMKDPEWARLAVQPGDRDNEIPQGEHPLGAEFFLPQRTWLENVDEQAAVAIQRSARLMMLAAVELVCGLDDIERGVQILQSSYIAVTKLVRIATARSETAPATVSAQNGQA